MSSPTRQSSSELFMVLAAVGILLMLFIPIPSTLLDILLICNFSWALTILLLTFYTDKPLSFSTFPALLLISTLFRLSLNISATRLIFADADAGKVIQSIGQYVIHGNYVIGLVVFLILIIVQFIVVTNGAQRVAEVAARFTLDSMPGKQMSIDADLNMGIISQEEAKKRRGQIEKEANFYGAMDGASKFVKGDAIAGILIILVDIIGGIAIGMAQKGFNLTESIHTYTLLTVGDGLVTQIPALIISTATGIIVTRAATDAALGSEVTRQIIAYPKTLVIVCFGLLGLLFLKGIPTLPVLGILCVFSACSWYAFRANKVDNLELAGENDLYERIQIYPLEITLNPQLYQALQKQEFELLEQIEHLREKIAHELGLVLPEVKLKPDPKLGFPVYAIAVQGHVWNGYHQLHMDRILALNVNQQIKQELKESGCIEVRDPTYGLPALWTPTELEPALTQKKVSLSSALSVLITHLYETAMNHLPELLSREETERLLQQTKIKKLADELVPALLSLGKLQKVLQNLLREKVSIRWIPQIMEVLLEHAAQINDPDNLTEIVRQKLSPAICQRLLASGQKLHVLTLEAQLEARLNQHSNEGNLTLAPELAESFLKSLMMQVEQMIQERKRPVLLVSSILRKHIKDLTNRLLPHLTVLGMNEIPVNIQVESYGVIK